MLIRLISLTVGLSIPLILVSDLLITKMSFVVWTWMFCAGLLSKGYFYSFISPFNDVPVDQQLSSRHIRYLDFFRSALLFSGIGFFIGNLIFHGTFGTIALGLFLMSIGVYISTHCINLPKKSASASSN